MTMRSSSCSAAVRVFAGLLVLCALTQSLVVTKFPHFQTFDSWDECSYAGTCYEKVSTSPVDTITTPPRHPHARVSWDVGGGLSKRGAYAGMHQPAGGMGERAGRS